MTTTRPTTLAIRALNQYRRRDVLSYLGLRYCLDASAARTEQWLERIAPLLVRRRVDAPYYRVWHFKDVDQDGEVQHRSLALPGPNEALAEALLLAACAERGKAFENPPGVFSYELSRGNESDGLFRLYIHGLRARHDAIAQACDHCPDGLVRYLDIRRFYPSISAGLAWQAWDRWSREAGLTDELRELGSRLLRAHDDARARDEAGILTGPMFSHLIGNLVLREFDLAAVRGRIPAAYFRYVDDITLVGSRQDVEGSLCIIRDDLRAMGFEIHDDPEKSITVTTAQWLAARSDYRETCRRPSWKTLIGDLKALLVDYPERRGSLARALLGAGFRLPLADYNAAAQEGSLGKRHPFRFARGDRQAGSPESIVRQALRLRKIYQEEFLALLDGFGELDPFERKRRVPKLRYRAGRLVYLAPEETLSALACRASAVPALHFHATVMAAVATGDVDGLLPLGPNAAQAAAQALAATRRSAKTNCATLTDAAAQAFAVLRLNGVHVERRDGCTIATDKELCTFADVGASIELMGCTDAFVRELACLHGASAARHSATLETPYSSEELPCFDAVELQGHSASP